MTPDIQILEPAVPAARPRFVVPRDDASDAPVRVVEYVRPARSMRDEPDALPERSGASWPVSPNSRLPNWAARLLFVWGLITLASLAGPCRPLSPSPASVGVATP